MADASLGSNRLSMRGMDELGHLPRHIQHRSRSISLRRPRSFPVRPVACGDLARTIRCRLRYAAALKLDHRYPYVSASGANPHARRQIKAPVR